MEVSTANLKLQQLEAEVQDLSSQESKDEASLAKVKKQLRDLEAKVKDQEEELDEQAGSIQMLEQVLPSYSATEKHPPPPPREAAYTLNFFVYHSCVDHLQSHFDRLFISNFKPKDPCWIRPRMLSASACGCVRVCACARAIVHSGEAAAGDGDGKAAAEPLQGD